MGPVRHHDALRASVQVGTDLGPAGFHRQVERLERRRAAGRGVGRRGPVDVRDRVDLSRTLATLILQDDSAGAEHVGSICYCNAGSCDVGVGIASWKSKSLYGEYARMVC